MRDGWVETTLGSQLTLEYGKPLTDSNRDGVGYPVFGSAGVVGMHSNPLVSEGPIIVVGRKGTAGAVYWSQSPCFIIDTAYFVQIKTDVDSKFLFLVLTYIDLKGVTAQTGVPGLNRERAYSLKCKIPPLLEQKRIVDLISSVDSYIGALQQQMTSVRSASNAQLEKIVSDFTDDWVEVSLGDVLEISRGGSPRPIQDYLTESKDGVNWVKIADATRSEKYIYSTLQRIKKGGVSRSREVFSGDFILSNSMSFGRPYIMRIDGCIHDGWLLLSKVSNNFDEDFLYNLLNSDYVQRQFESLAAGSGVRNLNIEVVKKVKVRIPAIESQKQLASVINEFDEFILKLNAQLDSATQLRNSVLSDLLSGNHEIPTSYDKVMGAA